MEYMALLMEYMALLIEYRLLFTVFFNQFGRHNPMAYRILPFIPSVRIQIESIRRRVLIVFHSTAFYLSLFLSQNLSLCISISHARILSLADVRALSLTFSRVRSRAT